MERNDSVWTDEEEGKKALVELPHGVFEVEVTDGAEWQRIRAAEEMDQETFEAFLLQNKANGKELDPRYFNEEERKAFQESDKKEWSSWIKNKVVRRLTEEEAAQVSPRNIFRAPARMIRVNKGAMKGILQAKSRMVIPGHLDPDLGTYRSDAPTCPWVIVQMAKSICALKGWKATIFDITTAFLSGKEVERIVYMRAPVDRLPPCEELGESAVRPMELMRVCKSAYGLSEAPRLWYLRATELLIECGFTELPMCKAAYAKRDKKGQVVCIICLHVDDGLVVCSPKELKQVKADLDSKFSIKEWQDLCEKPVTFLGVKTSYHQGIFMMT